jgi:hypothetical protein
LVYQIREAGKWRVQYERFDLRHMLRRYDGSRASHRDGIYANSLELLLVVCRGVLDCSLHVQGFTESKGCLGTGALAVRSKIESQHVEPGPAKEPTHATQIFPICPDTMAHHDERRSLGSE